MRLLLILIFLGVPILEIAVFIQAGDIFGLWPTLAAIVATAIIGGVIIRAQGLATLARARLALDEGRPPVREVFTGLCLLIAGALLMTPGFLTDTAGFVLLVPGVRESIGQWLVRTLFNQRNARVWVDGEEIVPPERGDGAGPSDAIDVEYTEIPPEKDASTRD